MTAFGKVPNGCICERLALRIDATETKKCGSGPMRVTMIHTEQLKDFENMESDMNAISSRVPSRTEPSGMRACLK